MLLLLFVARADASDWRTFAGGFSSRWNTLGHHGHDQDVCASKTPLECDAIDFTRANLDDSIGFRAGAERDVLSIGVLRLVAGADVGISHTEYNSSQRDFSLLSAAAFTGIDVAVGDVRAGARYGGGAFGTTTNEYAGGLRFIELTATLPLRDGAGVRIAKRNFMLSRMDASPSRDFSVMLVADTSRGGRSNWEVAAATGATMPGAGWGGDRLLRATALNRTAALRTLWRPDMQLELSWTSTAHESSVPSIFRGYDGNFRSKTIDGYGFALSRLVPFSSALALRLSAGFEMADWRDEHRLLTRDGAELVAGVETAVTGAVAIRVPLQPRLAFETSVQKNYWQSLDLGELRWTAGIVLTR